MITYKTHPQFPGYRFGSDGSVWSCRTPQGTIRDTWKQLKPKRNKRSGHLAICLRCDGETKTRWIHRLVLESFIGPCPLGMESRHLNGIPHDNRIDNLAWGGLGDNRRDRNIHGVWNLGESHPMAKVSNKDVEEIRRLRMQGETQYAIAKRFSLSQSYVSQILSGLYRSRA